MQMDVSTHKCNNNDLINDLKTKLINGVYIILAYITEKLYS